MRHWCPEQCKDIVAGGLRHAATAGMDGIDHEREGWIYDRSCLLRIESLDQFQRALDVREQGGEGLALAR